MEKKTSFFGSAFFYTFGVVLAQGTTFVTLLIIARMMTPDEYAMVSVYSLWASIFALIIGVQAYGSMNNAKIDFGESSLDDYTSVTFGLSIVSFAIVFAVLFIFGDFFAGIMRFPVFVLLLCAVQGYFTFVINHIANKYRILNQPKKFVLWTTLATVLRLALSIALIYFAASGEKYMGDIYGSVIAYSAVGALAMVFILKRSRRLYDRHWWKYCIALCVPYIFSGLANLILAQSDRYMLVLLKDNYTAGIYSYVYNIAMIATAIWTAFNNAWTVWYFDKTHAGKKAEIVDLYKKYSLFVTLFSLAVVLIAPDVVRVFGGEAYADGILMTPLIIGGSFFLFLYTFPVAYESYKRKTVYIAVGTVMAAALNIVLNLWFIPKWGGYGAAFTTVTSYIVMFVFHYIIAKYIIKGFEISFMKLLVPALIIIGGIGLTYAAIDIIALRWAAGIASLVIAYFVYKKSRNIMME